jgi:anti-sigma factor RsiW
VSHLGERLTALVDGELGHDERDRALAHLAGCEQCRAEAEAMRRLKSQLRSLREAAPASDLLQRLNALADAGQACDRTKTEGLSEAALAVPARPGPSADAGRPPGDRPVRSPRRRRRAPAGGAPSGRAGAVPRSRPRGRYLVVGAATLVLGVGTAAFAAGSQPDRLPRVTPALERFAVEHALTSNEMPMTDTTAVVEHRVGP